MEEQEPGSSLVVTPAQTAEDATIAERCVGIMEDERRVTRYINEGCYVNKHIMKNKVTCSLSVSEVSYLQQHWYLEVASW